jgi:hypothetical protein
MPRLVLNIWASWQASPASGTLLAVDKFVSSPEEDLGGQVPAQFAAELARDGDGLKGEFIPPGWHIAAALLAGHNEGLAA